MEITSATEPTPAKTAGTIRKALYILGTLILFLFSLDLLIASLQHLSSNVAEMIIMATTNPFTALFIGLLITAIIQSSSTTTSLVVALVASGSITLESAIPIIMGANVGTTITSTIVSLGFINKKREFRRAAAAGTYHDFFNILTVVLLFPLEYYYGFLSSLSEHITGYFVNPTNTYSENTVTHLWSGFDPIVDFFVNIVPHGFILAVLAFVLLFTSIILFRKLISNWLLAQSPERFTQFFFKSHFKSFLWGVITTAAIRSSTVTTSLVVPIVAKRIVSLRKAAPFILGANIGTTITAFIAATLNANTSSAMSIAMAHILFNLIGVIVFFPIPLLRKIPLELAGRLGRITLKYRLAGFVYILLAFFFIPFSLIYLSQHTIEEVEARYRKTDFLKNDNIAYRIVTRMNTGSRSGELREYYSNGNTPDSNPDKIFSIYKRNNALFVNNEMYLFNKPGSCWEGENMFGKYQSCIQKIIPTLTLPNGLSFDSVYVFRLDYYSNDTIDVAYAQHFISARYPIILKKEIRNRNLELILLDELVAFERK